MANAPKTIVDYTTLLNSAFAKLHNITDVETTTTASKAYAVGDYLIYGNQFYKVTTAITSGGTIVTTGSGANVTEDTVGGEIKSVKDNYTSKTLLTDTVGWTGKNLLPCTAVSGTYGGIPAVVNSDGTIYMNGEATGNVRIPIGSCFLEAGNYILSGSPDSTFYFNIYDGSTINGNDTGNGYSFSVPSGGTTVNVQIAQNGTHTASNLIFYPMIRRATEPAGYEPHHDSVEVIFEDNIYGVNLLDMSLASVKADNSEYGTWSNNVWSTGNVSFTVNNDGTTRVDVSGTASGTQVLKRKLRLKAGTYCISGCPSGGSQTSYAVLVANSTDTVAYGWDYGEGYTLTLANDETIIIKIRIQNGYATSNKIFSLMVTKLKNAAFRPYNSQSIQNQINANASVLGAKNLLPFPYRESTTTSQNVTFTVNGDGSITLSTPAEGASARTYIVLCNNFDPGVREKLLKLPTLKLTGGISNKIWMNFNSPVVPGNNADTGNGVVVKFQNENNPFNIALVVEKNTIITTPITVYPMLRLASDPDDMFASPVMTNEELTDAVIKHKSYDFTYTASTTAYNKQMVEVNNVTETMDNAISMWVALKGTTNDIATCNCISNGKAKICVENAFGHSSAISVNATLHVLYK